MGPPETATTVRVQDGRTLTTGGIARARRFAARGHAPCEDRVRMNEADRNDTARQARAPAKINLGLFLGPTRSDGRHELVTVMQSISLADELTLEPAPDGAAEDLVVCEGVEGPNLAAAALAAFRAATGWDAPPQRLTVDKAVPIAAGLGGGSGDAAATLRLASAASRLGDEALLLGLAAELGADVPAQVRPGRWLASGAGEVLRELPDPNPAFGVIVLPSAEALSTAAVYAQADRLGVGRDLAHLRRIGQELEAALALGQTVPGSALLINELQEPARTLCPSIDGALEQARDAGADVAMVSGSGPTVIGLFLRANVEARLERALAALAGREPAAIAAGPVGPDAGVPVPRPGASQWRAEVSHEQR
jgi:4-diphosphocytidyl-2-C-methyl-D-erythritol kinase